MIRKMLGLTLLAALTLAVFSTVAQAQAALEIPRGSNFTVENGNECSPNSDVVVFYGEPGTEPRRIGASLSDPSGHFSTTLTLPLSAVLGEGSITVECGIDGGVLVYDIVVVEATSTDLVSYAAYGGGALGALVLAGLLVSRVRKPESSDPTDPDCPPPAPMIAALAAVPEGEDDDETEYWFWDTTTEHGPVKRLACLTDTDFYLHEVPERAFSPLLELLATVGPEKALKSAFFRVAIADMDEIRYRGTEMQVSYRSGDEFVSRTINLATEVEGVMDLLSRRVPIIEATASAPPE